MNLSLIRRSDCQSARCQLPEEGAEVDLETKWKAEVDAEQRRRYVVWPGMLLQANKLQTCSSLLHVGYAACSTVLTVTLHECS
jgi:hypothetical protein